MSGAVNSSVANYVSFIGFFYPIFIILFLVIASIFNGTLLKGLVYLGGLGISTAIWYLSGTLLGSFDDPTAAQEQINPYCHILTTAMQNSHINLDTIISFFTLTYLLVPMIESNQINPYILTILLAGTAYNMYVHHTLKCVNSWSSLLIGACLGIIFGGIWFAIFWSSDNGKNRRFLFYNELMSNNVVCAKPKKQTFKCSVYKNGQLVSRSIV